MKIRLHTYAEVIEHLLDYLGASVTDPMNQRLCRRAVQSAYHEVAQARRWSYFLQRGRINCVAPQTTGTVAYDHTGGTYERMVTLTDATWPAWAAQGVLVINNVPYEVAAAKSATVVTLSVASNPGDDVAAGATYTLYRDTFPMPADCLAVNEMINLNHTFSIGYHHPSDWLAMQRIIRSPAAPRLMTITADPHYLGTMAVRFFPPPDQAYQLDFIYNRRPRPLAIDEYAEGLASSTSGVLTLTGDGTTFTSAMVGSVLRLSDGSREKPTGLGGASPAAVERVVVGFTDAQTLTLDADPQQTLSGVRYSISDPLDVEEGAMWNYFLREAESQLRTVKRMQPTASEEKKLRDAFILACEADARTFERRAAGDAPTYRPRLAHMPRGPDVS